MENVRPPSDEAENRLTLERNLWVATVRPDGRPHLVPVWFVWQGGKFYLAISPQSVKAANLRGNPRVTLAIEDGTHPVICEGEARFLATAAEGVPEAFQAKYDWAVLEDDEYSTLVEVAPRKWLAW
jgi:PPOX class probable F420-dependent enzyme